MVNHKHFSCISQIAGKLSHLIRHRNEFMSLYCAIDLHSTNHVPVVIDEHNKILFQKRLPNDLTAVLSALVPFRQGLYKCHL